MGYSQLIHIPMISMHEYEKLSPDDKFWHQMALVEDVKNYYTYEYERIGSLEWLKYKDQRLAKIEQSELLTKLRLEAIERIQTYLMSAARVFGYNPRFDVRAEGSKVWYRPRNKSAERMMERVDYIYMHKELQRG